MVNKRKTCGKSKKSYSPPLPFFSIDDCPENAPAAGYRNGSSLNNAGSNGNYWSSTPNSNTNNAYNLNFNSSNYDWNNNNRNNGHSVRPVTELTAIESGDSSRHFSITADELLTDLYRAYKDARKHKRGRGYQLKFEFHLENNLVELRDELISGNYSAKPSTCFVIHDPKMREVFAANFRDRIVHHLFYNYTHELFERTFINDSYSCIKGRGTHYGIERMKYHIRSVSQGYSRKCYVMKIDIKGYFMHINRIILLKTCREVLAKMKYRRSDVSGKIWGDKIDYEFVDYLLDRIVNSNPLKNCNVLGQKSDWNNLPQDKSLFYARKDCGLPIGNLSSQLFSNIYMNRFDQYVKRELGCRHYGRYVDDAYIVSDSREFLHSLIPKIKKFLSEELNLSINPDKLQVIDVNYGIEFLGAFIKPFRNYVSSSSLRRMKRKLRCLPREDPRKLQASVNSFLGILSHYDSYCLRRVLFGYQCRLTQKGHFSRDWLRFTPG